MLLTEFALLMLKFSNHSMILLKLTEVTANITKSKSAMTPISIGRLAKFPVIIRLLVASTM